MQVKVKVLRRLIIGLVMTLLMVGLAPASQAATRDLYVKTVPDPTNRFYPGGLTDVYDPPVLTVNLGDTVVFHNLTIRDHTFLTDDRVCDSPSGRIWCEVDVKPYSTVTFTVTADPAAKGVHYFYCFYDFPFMEGVIDIS